MKKTYYLLNEGRLSRRDKVLCFEAEGKKAKYLPIETVDELYCFGALDANSNLFNYLGQQGIHLHFFDYYENYTGSFAPREYLLAGKMLVEQTKAYLNPSKRLELAKQLLAGAVWNMLHNLKYYHRRERDLSAELTSVTSLHQSLLCYSGDMAGLMGLEGNIRQAYYAAFDAILHDTPLVMGARSRRPPLNEVNALISFGNSLCYVLCLRCIYRTQLNPTLSFLHEPGYRRYSLALDLAEVFKPLLVDRLIFRLVNRKQIQEKHFERSSNGCFLLETGRRIFLEEWDKMLQETTFQKSLNKHVSYRHLVRIECYKLAKDILGIGTYMPFRIQ